MPVIQTEYQFEGGIPGGTLPGKYQALDVAKLHGNTSDKWTRKVRAELEEMLQDCPGGEVLSKLLKGTNGLYTDFALHLIGEKQRLTSIKAVVLDTEGKPVMDKSGVAKTVSQSRQMTPDQFKADLIQCYGKYFTASDTVEAFRAEFPGGTAGTAEYYPNPEPIEAEVVSDIVLPTVHNNALDVNDAAIDTADATRGMLAGYIQQFLGSAKPLGEVVAAQFQQQFQQGLNAGLASGFANVGGLVPTAQPQEAQPVKKIRKKAVGVA